MEDLTILREKTEEARQRYGSRTAASRAETADAVARRLLRSEREDLDLPERPSSILVMTPEEARRSREELARRYATPPPLRPPAVPERFKHVRLENWEPKNATIETARQAVELWVRGVAEGKPTRVALVGPKGTSKSHLLSCAAWRLFEEHRIRAEFIEWFLFVDQLRDLDTAPHARRQLREARALIIDEARPTSNTDFDAIELAKIAMYAYSHKQPLLLATNWSSLDSLMGEPAADRFTIIPVNGPSAR